MSLVSPFFEHSVDELSRLPCMWNLLLHNSGCRDVCVQLRQELEKIRRRLEVELADTREQLAERTSQLHDVQAQLNRREQELQTALNRYCTSHAVIYNCLLFAKLYYFPTFDTYLVIVFES